MIKLKEIGAVVDKQHIAITGQESTQPMLHGFNIAIDQSGEIAIGFNRERLAETIYQVMCPINSSWRPWKNLDANKDGISTFYEIAGAIIKEEKSILEVVKT